ncbi:MAG: universal stress protein [Candidatus Dormiibacterota bacterium]
MIATSTPATEVRKSRSQAFKKILVAVNRSSSVVSILSTVAKLSTPVTRVKVLHLQERLTYPSRPGVAIDIETRRDAIEFALKAQAELRDLGVDAEISVGREVSGREAEQILMAAYDFGADLVIAGNHRKSGLDALLTGSTTRSVVRKSAIALLLVPEVR